MARRVEVTVTDHALWRYLERIGADTPQDALDAIRRDVTPAIVRGLNYYETNDGLAYALRGPYVLTVMRRGAA